MGSVETAREAREQAESVSPLEVENQRLQTLVSELIMNNQKLRFKVAGLEAELEKSQRGLKATTEWAGMLF
jgi:predicted RNase H-like nuclease (RuvC/YqgF family)